MQLAGNLKANWQEEYCFIMTIPDPIQAEAIQERIRELQCELLEHPPYSPDLAPSDFHIFVELKNHVGGKPFADDEGADTEVRQWLRQRSKDFCIAGLDILVKRSDKCINVGGAHDEK
jgi:histone-lysine N-methyltransferase SETMAR